MSAYSPAGVQVSATPPHTSLSDAPWRPATGCPAPRRATRSASRCATKSRRSAIASCTRAPPARPRRCARVERVALALPPGLAFAEALHGCLLLGAPAMPVDPRLAARERAALLAGVAVRVDAPLGDAEDELALRPP